MAPYHLPGAGGRNPEEGEDPARREQRGGPLEGPRSGPADQEGAPPTGKGIAMAGRAKNGHARDGAGGVSRERFTNVNVICV